MTGDRESGRDHVLEGRSRPDSNDSWRGDRLDDPVNYGRGAPTIHSRMTSLEAVVELAKAYKWPIIALVAILLAGIYFGAIEAVLAAVPDLGWSSLFYLLLGLPVGLPLSYLVWRQIGTISGIEIWDHDPVTGSHRHLRIGEDLWDDMRVRSPWGREVSTNALRKVTINGRSGFEIMDLRIPENGPPSCVSTWMGEADASMLRTYKSAINYARDRLSEQAQRNVAMEANKREIARESAERVVMWNIREAERSGMPNGEEIAGVVDEVLEDHGLGDPLDSDDLDRGDPDLDRAEREGGAEHFVPSDRDLLRNDGGGR